MARTTSDYDEMASLLAAATSLEKYQCMFTWHHEIPYPISSSWVVSTVEDKLCSSDCEWASIVYHLVLAFENYRLGKVPAARDNLLACEDIIASSECFNKSPLVERNLDGIKHVLYSTWLHLVDKTESFETFKDYVAEVPIYRKMSPKQKAGVISIHAACFMEYGIKGHRRANLIIEQALRYDEHEGHWHYLKAETLRYERLHCQEIEAKVPTEEELKCFRLAHFYDDHTPSHCIGLAASLYDSVKIKSGPSETRDEATRLYKTALEKWPNSAYVTIMCTIGLLSYAYPVRDTKLADQCLGKSLGLAPQSSLVNMVAGIFFKWPSKNERSATRHFNLAKKRYTSLVEDIANGQCKTYRQALVRAITEDAPMDIMAIIPNNDSPDSPDDDSDIIENDLYMF